MARSCYIVILIESWKASGTSFQSPVLSQKHVRNIGNIADSYLTKFHFDGN